MVSKSSPMTFLNKYRQKHVFLPWYLRLRFTALDSTLVKAHVVHELVTNSIDAAANQEQQNMPFLNLSDTDHRLVSPSTHPSFLSKLWTMEQA